MLNVLSCGVQTREVADAMAADAGCALRLLRADGGCSRNGLLMQLQADALQVLGPAAQASARLLAVCAVQRASSEWPSCAHFCLMRSHLSPVPWSQAAFTLTASGWSAPAGLWP